MSHIHRKLGRKYEGVKPKMLKMAETKPFMNIKLITLIVACDTVVFTLI